MGTGNSQNNGTAAGQNLLALPEGVELGQYRIIHTLGQGGFGITYLAEVIGSGEQVVIKENLPTFCAMRDRTTLQVTATNPNDELQEYAGYLERFVNEARLLAQLNHPNIVKVLGAFEALGTAYYVMPWVGGQELQTAAPAPTDITEQWLLPILRTLLSTLEYLHGRNIYHRDVKPANILLTEDGIPVLIDFGTARAIISDRSATHVGSPGYSPIEQLRSKGKRGPWTDVYSLGATCYRLITGENPPDALDRMEEDDDPLLPLAPRAELHGRFSPEFLATIDKALDPRGKDRWQTAAEWLAVLPVPAPQPAPEQAPPTTPEIATTPIAVAPEPARRSRPNVVLILLILVLALGIPGGYVLYQHAREMGAQRLLARQESESFGELLQQMHAGLSAAQQEIAPAAERVAAGQPLSEQSSLLQHFDSLRQTAAAAKSLVTKLSAESLSGSCGTLPADPPAFRSFITDFCNNPSVTADSLSNEQLLTLLGWDSALAEAKRKSAEEAEVAQRTLSGKGISESEYSSRIISAAGKGDKELLALLIAAGADVNAAGKDGRTPLYRAASEGRSECVKLLLAAPGIDVNKANKDGNTPLNWAIWNGRSECVRLLLAAPGIDVNKADKDGETPLYRAAWKGHSACVKLLLAAPGIDVNKANEVGWTPLTVAAYNGRTECVRMLLAVPGIDVNKANKNGWSPLYGAASYGHSACVKLLLAAPGIDVNKADKDGETPLWNAACNGHTECVKLLLAAPDIDVNKADKDGRTPLYWAAYNGLSECVRLLLAVPGIDFNAANKDGRTPLTAAAYKGRTECVRLLLAVPGIDVNAADKDGETPLYWATCNGHSEYVKLLLAAPGIDVNKANNFGWTPLFMAAYNGHTECVRLLLAAPGIDVNEANKGGRTPLTAAAYNGRTECVKLLLAAPGIDVNAADNEGYTPLNWAARNGHSECVRLLLAAPGIDVNKANKYGWTPVKAAEITGHSECARLIRAAGGKE